MSYNWHIIIWLSVMQLLVFSFALTSAKFKFTNLKCEVHDKTFARVSACKLTIVRRGIVVLNLNIEILKSPVSNSTVNIALYRKTNGYKPHLLNVSADVCAFFENRHKYPVVQAVFSSFSDHSNLNHTCPFSGSIIIKDLLLNEGVFQLIPLAGGQYYLNTKIYAYKDLKTTIKVYFELSE